MWLCPDRVTGCTPIGIGVSETLVPGILVSLCSDERPEEPQDAYEASPCPIRAGRRHACRSPVDYASRSPRTARRCARSTSACRWRRRTWCTPRLTWRRRWAISPSAASTPTSCSSKAASRRPRRSRPRRAPRSSASATSRSAAASRCSRSGASRRACRRPTWWPEDDQESRRPQGQAAVAPPAAASAASTGAWAARC